jgi:hypothetical protein
MLKNVTRAKLILLWFSAVALLIAGGIALGAEVATGTGALVLALSLVPPALVLMLWSSKGTPTIAEVIHDAEGRS